MPRRRIHSQVFSPYRSIVPVLWLRKVAKETLSGADPDGIGGVGLVIGNDATLHDLNFRFRGIDEVTDVLAFSEKEESSEIGAILDDVPIFPNNEGEQSLGEVVVSYPRAVRQANDHGWDVHHELALLIIHGILHLLGHDHLKPREAKKMKMLEEQTLSRLFVDITKVTM